MKQYELMVLFHPDIKGDDEKKQKSLLDRLLGEDKKYITSVKPLGKKALAYPIRKCTEGVYALIELSADRIDVSPMNNQAKLMPEILRFMLIVKE